MPPGLTPILPGATIGWLGGGQLGRMAALAARAMGYRVAIFCPEPDSPAAQVADVVFNNAYDDIQALQAFADAVSVVTFEFENLPAASLTFLAQQVPVFPEPNVLLVTQNRIREKRFLSDAGFPVAPFAIIESAADLASALTETGLPAVLKTAASGYDGKGQVKITDAQNLDAAWTSLGHVPCVLEAWMPFISEFSVVCARGRDGAFAHYGCIENRHRNHILDISVAPAALPEATQQAALAIARAVADALNVVGVFCLEFFYLGEGQFCINELAPRPHNSGHLTIEGCITDQFAQQVRAVCGLPLGDTRFHGPAAMANLLGDLWQGGEPDWLGALTGGEVQLHLYGKPEARPGRKMGHLTALADTPEVAVSKVLAARAGLHCSLQNGLEL